MEALVFVGYFEEVLNASLNFLEYQKILIIENEINNKVIENGFDEIILVADITDKGIMSGIIKNVTLRYRIHSIYANIEWAVEVCGYLREKFHIIGMPEDICIKTRDKYVMKTTLASAGIKTANVASVDSLESLKHFILKNDFPIVLKPRKGSATQNTFLIHNEKELKNVFENIELFDEDYIVESFIKGEEYHCDTIVFQGKIKFCSVSKYNTNLIETINTNNPVSSIVFPESFDNNPIIKNIKELNEKVIHALHIDTSICHLEVFVTERNECIFGEIASRIGGGPLIGRSIKCAYGVDLYEIFIELFIKQRIEITYRESRFAGFIALPIQTGEIVKIAGTDDYIKMEDIKYINIYNKVGDVITDKNNTTKRTGYIIVIGDDYNKLKERLLELYNNFKLEVKKPKLSILSIY